ncbi:MAG: bifunctional diaminohydroxyphosphoribosylaminopyrimidine deaminase/5-amino-6-(5-phosphoribosylamino)uracil reductase RibD [Planctomycetota bacterium]
MVRPDLDTLFEEAARLARRGLGLVAPNPLVGALALREGRIVGSGFHERWGGPHAEEAALRDCEARGDWADALLVTLEPCSSRGGVKKRPPCTDLLLEHGIRRLYVGCLDPDPRHQGQGIERMRARGVTVEGPFETPALRALLRNFERALTLRRPWVLAKWAMTLDGKLATRTGSSRWISGEAALDYAHGLRSGSDAVLVGIGTLLADDPALTVRRVRGRQPLRVLYDPALSAPPDAKLFATVPEGPVLVLCSERADAEAEAAVVATGAQVLRCPELPPGPEPGLRLDLGFALGRLYARGTRRLLCEGGAGVQAELLDQRCLDQVEAILAPKLVGGRAAPSPIGGAGLERMEDAWQLDQTYTRALGECLAFGGFLSRPGSDVDP